MKFSDSLGMSHVMSPEEEKRLEQKLARACKDLPIILLYIHGSYAAGTQNPLSDVDLAVLMEHDAGLDRKRRFKVITALDETCGRDDMDLVVLNTAGPIIKDRVVRNGRILYEKSEEDRIRFEASAIKESLDFKHFSREYDDALFSQLKEGRFID